MKLEYQKPYLAVESFQLNAAIAGSCASKSFILSHSVDTCSMLDGDGHQDSNAFYFGSKCATDGGSDIVNTTNGDSLCYQNYTQSVDINASYVES